MAYSARYARVTVALLLTLLAAALVSCDGNDATAPVTEPAIVGLLTAADTNLGSLRILVEEDPAVNEPRAPRGDKLWLRVGGQTRVFDARGDSTREVSATAFQIGQRVAAAVHTGVRESYPGQASADTIVIVQ